MRLYLERRIIVAFAGQPAEARYRGRRPNYGSEQDRRNADELIRMIGFLPRTAEAFRRYCFLRATDFVQGP